MDDICNLSSATQRSGVDGFTQIHATQADWSFLLCLNLCVLWWMNQLHQLVYYRNPFSLMHSRMPQVLLIILSWRVLLQNVSSTLRLQHKCFPAERLSHLSIVVLQDRAYEIVEDMEANKVHKMKKRICLVLDCLCAHDFSDKTADLINLQHYVIKEKRLSEREAIVIFYDVVHVVEALHKVSQEYWLTITVQSNVYTQAFFMNGEKCWNASVYILFSGLEDVTCLVSRASFLITHFPFLRATPRNRLIVLIPVIHSHNIWRNLSSFFSVFSCMQKNIVHRDLKLGNMVLNKR